MLQGALDEELTVSIRNLHTVLVQIGFKSKHHCVWDHLNKHEPELWGKIRDAGLLIQRN